MKYFGLLKPLKTHLYWLKFQDWWLYFIITITGMTITYIWRAFSEISSVYHIFHCFITPQLASCPQNAPAMRAALFFMFMFMFFMFMMDFWNIFSGILPNSTLTFLFKAAMFWCLQGEVVVHFLFQLPPKKEITWVAVRWVGGPGVPPQALDGKHPVLEDGV